MKEKQEFLLQEGILRRKRNASQERKSICGKLVQKGFKAGNQARTLSEFWGGGEWEEYLV